MTKYEPVRFFCAVCGAELPNNISTERMIAINCAVRRSPEQVVYYCKDRHTPDEIAAAITGVPRFKRANEIKNSIIETNNAK